MNQQRKSGYRFVGVVAQRVALLVCLLSGCATPEPRGIAVCQERVVIQRACTVQENR